jgi:RHS repeat-associated protein
VLTKFLYSGEQFDSKIGQQYLRARYYDPATGRFNRLDPFFGNLVEPLSLHNYLYCHIDPVSFIDPSGEFWIPILALLGGTLIGAGIGYYNDGWRGAAIGGVVGFGAVFAALSGFGIISAPGVIGRFLYSYPIVFTGMSLITGLGVAVSYFEQGSLSARLGATYCFRGMSTLTGFGLLLTHGLDNNYEFTDDGSLESLLNEHKRERYRWLVNHTYGPYMPSNSPWKKFYIDDFVETGIKLSFDVVDGNFWLTNLGGLKVSGSYEMNIETRELRNLDLTWIAWDGIDCNPDATMSFGMQLKLLSCGLVME